MAEELNSSAIGSRLIDIANSVEQLKKQVNIINIQNEQIESDVMQVREDLNNLTIEFRKMVQDQKRTAILQKAITELVRVRQQIGQRYGNYTVIRETMLGVLQATDAALVKKTTISRVSEELMLSTPQYWLAPCLVAISAWIANDRDLAERAIAEAMKRDEEKTSLCMALICRRNGRIDTGYEWLSIYFSSQNATSITEETFTYIDAYINGVFGPDDKHMCQGYIAKWIDEIRGNKSDFEAAQEKKWEQYCDKFKIDVRELYPDLAEISPEFTLINASLGKINSYTTIRDNFKGITDAFVDQDTMKKAIDTELIHLISNYDRSEIDIRREEEYLSLVKYYDGDEEKAKKDMIAREAKRQQHKLDFFEQMASEITSDRDTAPSKRRTAVTFLSNYINRGYTRYADGAKSAFPNIISLNVDSWTGKTADGSEYSTLSADYERTMNMVREDTIHREISVKPKVFMIIAIILFVFGAGCIAGALALSPVFWVAVFGSILGGAALFLIRAVMLKNTGKRIARINEEFAYKIAQGKAKIDASLKQWRSAKDVMSQYNDEGEHKVA